MRINPPIAVVACILAAMTALGVNRHREEQRLQVRCDVALAYATQLVGERRQAPLFFIVDFEPYPPPGRIDEFLASPEGRTFRDDPMIPLLRQQDALRNQSPVRDCSNLRAFLTDKGIASGVLGDHAPFGPGGIGRVELIGMSMPAVDPDRGMAIFDASETAGPLAGQGFAVTMERASTGRWRIKSKHSTWVS